MKKEKQKSDRTFKILSFKEKGINYKILVPVIQGQYRDIFIDFCMRDIPVIKKFYDPNKSYSLDCDRFFVRLKKQLEARYGNILLVINNPTTFNSSMLSKPSNQFLVNLTIYNQIQDWDKKEFAKRKAELVSICLDIQDYIKSELNKLPDAY